MWKVHAFILKNAKDASSNTIDFQENIDNPDEDFDDTVDRLKHEQEFRDYESEYLTDFFYDDIDLSILLHQNDIWKHFSYYEKYLLYLKFGLKIKNINILNILKYETKEDLNSYLEDIIERLHLLAEE